MDLVKIGRFISECRKEKGLTQSQLAEKLNITDKAVSKWETGKGMPDVSIMIELCDILGISVNELLSGEKLSEENYREKANENIVSMIKVADKNRKTKNRLILIFAIIISVVLIFRVAIGIYESIEIGMEYDERIMQCEITENDITYKVNGLSIINAEREIINTDSETLIFITNKIYLMNKIRSHYETWDSMAKLNKGEDVSFSSSISIDINKDIPDCKDKIKVYYTNKPLYKIKKADRNELQQIIDKSHLICESE